MNNIKKIVQVAMLPTDRATKLIKHTKTNRLFFDEPWMVIGERAYFQHLYFTSNEEIEQDNFYYNQHINKIGQCDGNITPEMCKAFEYKKIVATTDESLIKVKIGNLETKPLYAETGIGLIPESFLVTYVEAKGLIKEVMVEYKKMYRDMTGEHEALMLTGSEYNKIKLNPDNTVIVSHQPRLFTIEELSLLLFKFDNRVIVNTDLGAKESSLSWLKRILLSEFGIIK